MSSTMSPDSLIELPWKKSLQSVCRKSVEQEKWSDLTARIAMQPPSPKSQKVVRQQRKVLEGLGKLAVTTDCHKVYDNLLKQLVERLEATKKDQKRLCDQQLSDETEKLLGQPRKTSETASSSELLLEGWWLLLAGSHLSDEQFLRLYERVASQFVALEELEAVAEGDRLDALDRLLLTAELRSVLGFTFSAFSGAKNHLRSGLKAFSRELFEQTDTDGTPHAELLDVLPLWVASFRRGAILAEWSERELFKKKGEAHWQDFLQRSASLTNSQGELSLANGCARFWPDVLGDSLSGLKSKKQANWQRQTNRLLGIEGKAAKGKVKRGSSDDDLSAATQSDWAHLAMLRCNWYPGSDQLQIAYANHEPEISLSTLGLPFLEGTWQTELHVGDQSVTFEEGWESLCWYNDEAGDYLELRMETEAATIDRQLFLSRTDHVALLADSVTSKIDQPVKLQWSLPVVSGSKSTGDRDSRALRFRRENREIRLLPLALPDEFVHRPEGKVEYRDEALLVEQTGQQNLCMPLWLDWSPDRQRKACDWSQLTVTENREILPSRMAFGARCRVAGSQWLFFRNLEYSGIPRAILGLHTDAETILAEFPSTGVAEKLVEVHYEDEDEE